MIKVHKHRLVCRCDDCSAMFAADRFEPTWTMAEPATEPRERVLGKVPLGSAEATWTFVAWVDGDQRLCADWPGFPGTRGARVELAATGEGDRVITGTRDPALMALAEPIPLRRLAAERVNARCMVEHGLAPPDVADFIECGRHGRGIAALACDHVVNDSRVDAIVVYGVDGDYPDLFCEPCLQRYSRGEVQLANTVCSGCQQEHLYRHRLVTRTWYGA